MAAIADLPVPETGAIAELPVPGDTVDPQQADVEAFRATAGPARRGFRGGMNQVGAMLSNTVGQTGLTLGLSEFAEDRFADAAEYTRRADEVGAPVRDTGSIRNFADLVTFVAGHMGSGLATSAPILATAAVTKRPIAGVFGGAAALETGEQVGTLRADPVVRAKLTPTELLGHAAGKGAVAGAMELGGATGQVTRRIARQQVMGIRRAAQEAPGAIGRGIAGEAVTEAGQDIAGQVGHQIVNPEVEIDPRQALEAAAAGAAGGAGISIAGSALETGVAGARELRQRLQRDRIPLGEGDVPSGIDRIETAEGIADRLEEGDIQTEQILREAAGRPENAEFADFATSPEKRAAFIGKLRKEHFGTGFKRDVQQISKAADALRAEGVKASEERTATDEGVHKVMMKFLPTEFSQNAEPTDLLTLSQSIRQMIQQPAAFRNSATVSTLKRVLGPKYQDFLSEAIGQIYGSREGKRQAQQAIDAATGEVEELSTARQRRIQNIVRNNLQPRYLADPTLKDVVDEELAPQIMNYVEAEGELSEEFVAAMQEAFGEKTEFVLDQLDALRRQPTKELLEQEHVGAPFADDPRVGQVFRSYGDATTALEGLRKDFGPHEASFRLVTEGVDPKTRTHTIVAEDPDQFTLSDSEFQEVREPKEFGDTEPEFGIFKIKRTGGHENNMNAVRLTRLMMRKDRQQTREGGRLKYVSDVFSRGISALMSRPDFKGLDKPFFPDDLLIVPKTKTNPAITYGMIRTVEFGQAQKAKELRAKIRQEKEGTPGRKKALRALGRYYQNERAAERLTQIYVNDALEDLANGVTVEDAVEPMQDKLTQIKDNIGEHTPEYRRMKRGIEYVENQAGFQAERAAEQGEVEEFGTTAQPQDAPGIRKIEEETGRPVGEPTAGKTVPSTVAKPSKEEQILGELVEKAGLAEAPKPTPRETPAPAVGKPEAPRGEELGLIAKREREDEIIDKLLKEAGFKMNATMPDLDFLKAAAKKIADSKALKEAAAALGRFAGGVVGRVEKGIEGGKKAVAQARGERLLRESGSIPVKETTQEDMDELYANGLTKRYGPEAGALFRRDISLWTELVDLQQTYRARPTEQVLEKMWETDRELVKVAYALQRIIAKDTFPKGEVDEIFAAAEKALGKIRIILSNEELEGTASFVTLLVKLHGKHAEPNPYKWASLASSDGVIDELMLSAAIKAKAHMGLSLKAVLHHELGHGMVGRMYSKWGSDTTAKVLQLANSKEVIDAIKKNFPPRLWAHWIENSEERFVQAYAMWQEGKLKLPKANILQRVFEAIEDVLNLVLGKGEKLQHVFEAMDRGDFAKVETSRHVKQRLTDPRFFVKSLGSLRQAQVIRVLQGSLIRRLTKQFGDKAVMLEPTVSKIATGRHYINMVTLLYMRELLRKQEGADLIIADLKKEGLWPTDKVEQDLVLIATMAESVGGVGQDDPGPIPFATDPDALIEPFEPSPEAVAAEEARVKELQKQAAEAGVLNEKLSDMDLGTQRVSPELVKQVEAYVAKVLGTQKTKVIFEKLTRAGEFADLNGVETLKISVDAIDPRGVGYHEALHALFQRLIKADPKAARVLTNAANAAPVVARLRELLADHPKALKQLSEPEERVAYLYQFWASGHMGLLPVGPETQTWFDKVRTFFKKAAAVWFDNMDFEVAMQASEILNAFHNGAFADRSDTAQVIHEHSPTAARDSVAKAWPALGTFIDRFAFTAAGAVRDYDIPALTEIINKMHSPVTGEGVEPGFLQSKHVVYNQLLNRVAAEVEDMSEAEQKAVWKELIEKNPRSAAAKEIRKVLDDAYNYLVKSEVKTIVREDGKVKRDADGKPEYKPLQKVENYSPRVFKLTKVRDDYQPFIDMLKRNGRSQSTAEGIRNNIIEDINSAENAQGDETLDLTFYAPFTNERTLGDIPDTELAPFLEDNLFGIMSQYLARAARRGEYTRRFGNSGELITEARKEAVEQGADERQLRVFDDAVKAMEGTLGANMTPEMRTAFGAITTYQNVRLLPLALFASLVDPFGIMVRGGTFGEATGAFFRGLKEVFSVDKDIKYNIARLSGTINIANDVQVVSDMYSSQFMSPTMKKLNELFFKYNGMEGWNRSMRTSATAAAINFLQRHAFESQGEKSDRYLRELNITRADIKNDPDGNLILTDKVKVALNMWVDQAILRPNAALRPIYMSDPNWILVSHLKQYTYLFQQVILNRVYSELKHGNYDPAFGLMSYLPVIIMSDMARSLLTPGSGDDHPEWEFEDYLWRGVQRAGFFGPGQMVLDSGADLRYGGAMSLLGPSGEQLMDFVGSALGGSGIGEEIARGIPGGRFFL